ncbi:MAG TPA: four helix bundle protein [Thermoflexia bacterium]|nr:four helix bundle protein [Thermoflexia bacterium]
MEDEGWKNYEDWLQEMPPEIAAEDLWKFFGYRKSLFFYDICWRDCEKLLPHPLGRTVAQQLIRSAGSISANIEEGYGRGFGKARAHFLRIALGSARESKGWYYRSKTLLSPEILQHRWGLLNEIIPLLITEANRMKKYHR